MKRFLIIFITALLLCPLCVGCGEQPTPVPSVTKDFVALDTDCHITLYNTDDTTLIDAAIQLVQSRDSLWSRTAQQSDVFKLNASGGAPVSLDPATVSLVETAQFYTMLSDGAFDITAASFSDMWRAAETSGTPPTKDALLAACATVGADKLLIQDGQATLAPGSQIDLGGIAKGQIADEIAAQLKAAGCTSALIDLGGNIVTVGKHPNGSNFRVGVADPRDQSKLIATLEASDCAVVTSGSYQRGFTVDGKTYSHIIDPSTGNPVQNDLLSVTIIASLAVDADALSTACFVMGYDGAIALLEQFDAVGAVFVMSDGSVRHTDGVKLV